MGEGDWDGFAIIVIGIEVLRGLDHFVAASQVAFGIGLCNQVLNVCREGWGQLLHRLGRVSG